MNRATMGRGERSAARQQDPRYCDECAFLFTQVAELQAHRRLVHQDYDRPASPLATLAGADARD